MNVFTNEELVVNGTTYEAQLGGVVDKYLTDSFDSLVLNVKCKATEDFELMTLVTVDSNYWYIGNKDAEVNVYDADGNAEVLTYELTLFSPTMLLSKKMCSAFQITQPIDPTASRKILSEEINKLQYKTDGKPFNFLMTSDLYLKTKVEAKEVNMGDATLQEALNVLLSQVNCIVVGKIINGDFYIDAKELEPTENETIGDISTKKFSQSGGEYATALNAKLTSGLSSSKTKSEGSLTLRCDNEFVLNDSNAELVMKNDIYSISNLYLYLNKLIFKIQYTDTVTGIGGIFEKTLKNYSIDFATDHLLEKKAYDLKEPISDEWNFGTDIDSGNQNFYLYYEMGKRLIQGFGKTWNHIFAFDQAIFSAILEYELKELAKRYLTSNMGDPIYTFQIYNESDVQERDFIKDYTLWKFNVVYRAIEQYKLQIGKTLQDSYDEEFVMPDKQNESFVNINIWGDNEQYKVDRTGNKYLQVTTKFASENDIPEVGDKSGDFVLIHEQYSVYPDYVKFIGDLYEKHTANNLFNGIAQQKRIYQVDTNYFNREILFKYKIRFTTQVEESEDFSSVNVDNKLIYSIYGGLVNSNNNTYALTDFFFFAKDSKNRDSIYYGKNHGRGKAWMQATNSRVGNSVAIHMSCLTNSYIGDTRYYKKSATYGGYPQYKIQYVDEYGELERAGFGAYTQSDFDTWNEYCTDVQTRNLPYWGDTSTRLMFPYNYIYKTQNEQLGFTIQYECNASKDMTFTNLPYIAENIILKPNDRVATSGLRVTNEFGGIGDEPYVKVIGKTELEIETLIETPRHILYLNNVKVLEWGSERKIHVYIQR